MSLGKNSLVAAYQGKGKRTVDHQRTRVVTVFLNKKVLNLFITLINPFYRAWCQSEWDILPRQFYCQEATVRCIPDIPGWGFVFQRDGALAHQARDTVAFLERKVPDFFSPTLWPSNSPDMNPVNYTVWSVLHRESLPIHN